MAPLDHPAYLHKLNREKGLVCARGHRRSVNNETETQSRHGPIRTSPHVPRKGAGNGVV